jgi:hypothetical protein|tara:strand:+ start:295 stop:429 length:135 start_codon:yes stop_codon:yes gene_type:complete
LKEIQLYKKRVSTGTRNRKILGWDVLAKVLLLVEIREADSRNHS